MTKYFGFIGIFNDIFTILQNDFESNFILNVKNFEKKMINNRKIKKEYVFKKFIYNTFFKGDFIDY